MASVLGDPDKHSPASERELHLTASKCAEQRQDQGLDLWASLSRLCFLHIFFLAPFFIIPSLLVPDSYLQEVPSTSSHHGPLFAFKAIYHHHQVHVRVLLPDCTVTPDPLNFVVRILRKQEQERKMHEIAEHRDLHLSKPHSKNNLELYETTAELKH